MKQEIFLYLIGTAGSGKSTLTASLHSWFSMQGLDSIMVNLDPGAENLAYEPDVDIRDWISLKETMETYELGPNGAQIACADMIALNSQDVKESITSFKSDYTIVDTPGQLELFVFRQSGKYMVEFLQPQRSVICYLLDPILARSPSGFTSQLLLSLTTHFRLSQPHINVLSKSDLLTNEDIETIKRWAADPDELYGAIINESASVYREVSEGIVHLLQEFGGHTLLIPTSQDEHKGVEDIYTALQLQFTGGEDTLKD